jgi:hypothetical protein
VHYVRHVAMEIQNNAPGIFFGKKLNDIQISLPIGTHINFPEGLQKMKRMIPG